jgi:hypothetical protein
MISLTLTGDVVVQRGTNHKWLKVKDGAPVKLLVCLIDGCTLISRILG